MKWSRQPLRIFLKSIVIRSNAKCPWNFVPLPAQIIQINRRFRRSTSVECIRLARNRLHLFHRVLTGQVTIVFIESTVDSHNISRDSFKKWREWNQLCWNACSNVRRVTFFCVEECGLHATAFWVLRVFLHCIQGPLTKTFTGSNSNDIILDYF